MKESVARSKHAFPMTLGNRTWSRQAIDADLIEEKLESIEVVHDPTMYDRSR